MAKSYREISEWIQQSTEDKWDPKSCAVFFRVKDEYGALSNMAGRMPIEINDVDGRVIVAPSSEHLYQAGRFSGHELVQKLILEQRSAMGAKMAAKPHLALTRKDWEEVRVTWMLWCLRQKLASNWTSYGTALHATGDKSIVERSSRDPFWGAVLQSDGLLHGRNVLGQLHMWMRAFYQSKTALEARVSKCPVRMNFLGGEL